jgi:hypothetical protein
MSKFKLTLWCIAVFLCCFAVSSTAQVYEKVPELHGDSVVFPITLINAFPFISATVNGVEGKFMFDTGSAGSITLNDNFSKLPNKKIREVVWYPVDSPLRPA